MTLTLGILLCDDHYPESQAVYGHYDEAFKRLFDNSAVSSFVTYRVFENTFPSSPSECDVWLVTGSKWGVYESDPWITQLINFVQRCDQEGQALIGVCFGHQLIHLALGGKAAKSNKGWGMGLYPVGILDQDAFDTGAQQASLNLIAVHQDQVLESAPDFDVLAGSDFCPIAITQKDTRVLTMQCHPEFTDEFLLQLIERLREKAGDEKVDEAAAIIRACGMGDRSIVINRLFAFLDQQVVSREKRQA
ncbi:glutamine amidotransferase-related protein [Enterovibrio norvegicus]|uniref:glutamine amidotransferase-related protein n=1 Tax=Enterovibrio norvegicus TaxID=188144 RepID=UPI000C826CBF|nr:glutamine amidotransferase [Enterovibrio norvegicus]PML77836.1 glutamine amidotransferase [Enterovibrio norvegicus]